MAETTKVPAHLDRAWWVAVRPIWDAMNEDDDAYPIALAVVLALDNAGLLQTPSAAPSPSGDERPTDG